jgi:hypothetical protein
MPIELRAPGGSYLIIDADAYQFPDLAPELRQHDGLMISLSASDGERTWNARSPSLLTSELAALAWFRAIARREGAAEWWWSVEDELTFREISGSSDDALTLVVELWGSFNREPGNFELDRSDLRFELSRSEFSRLATEVDEILSRFPVRDWI